MFRYVDALSLLPLTLYPKTHTHTHNVCLLVCFRAHMCLYSYHSSVPQEAYGLQPVKEQLAVASHFGDEM